MCSEGAPRITRLAYDGQMRLCQLLIAVLLVPSFSVAAPSMSVVPNAFPPSSASSAQVCLVASNLDLVLASNEQYIAVFDASISNLSSDDIVRPLNGASGLTATHDSAARTIRFRSDGTDMATNSGACVNVAFTTAAATPSIVIFSTSSGQSITPSAQPIAIITLPVGPQGTAGPAGPQGPPGLQGAAGPQGAPGANGTNGVDGQSATTSNEAPGANCSTGGIRVNSASGTNYVCNGASGATGAPGPQGPTGPEGKQGLTGPEGPKGTEGDSGAPGSGGCSSNGDHHASLLLAAVFVAARRRRRS